jgi:PAS domain S-box-containing protein
VPYTPEQPAELSGVLLYGPPSPPIFKSLLYGASARFIIAAVSAVRSKRVMSSHANLAHGPMLENSQAWLAAIVDSSFDAIISKDLNSIITSWNRAAERLFGYSPEEAIGQSILLLIPRSNWAEETDIINRIRNGQTVETYKTTRLRKDGTPVLISLTVSPIRNANGEIVGASKIARDITAAHEAERRIKMLLREVNHRVKNQYSVILSIIRETVARSPDPADFQRRIRERIMGLASSHDLLVTGQWSGASLLDLVQAQLQPFGHETCVLVSGPILMLRPMAVQYLGMAFHELGTNSSKYGVLSEGQGRVNISWTIEANTQGAADLVLTWEEKPVSAAPDPLRRGFGSVVLDRVAPQAVGGTATLVRSAEQVLWSLRAPLDNLTPEPDPDVEEDDAVPGFDTTASQ